ncbi:hypothetical protein DFJ77DRAFT_473148 [Powellomyces hirtus]|nr:hypothetical protein DFJ77DRAFT_473148 [Powellomyces hirtus]
MAVAPSRTKKPRSTNRQLKLYIHPPSIPTRFQTFCFEDGERNAFGSSASRFNRRLDELPGPGYYVAPAVDDPKKGARFASKSKRFVEESIPQPSPTQYHPRSAIYSHSVAHSPSAAFVATRDAAAAAARSKVPLWSDRFNKDTPGPGAYDTTATLPTVARQQRRCMAVFKSTSRRSEINEAGWTMGRDAPAPDAYSILESRVVKDVPGAQAAFRAVPRKDAFPQTTESHPGPGYYNLQALELHPESSVPNRPLWRPGPPQPLHHTPAPPTTPLSGFTSIPGSNAPPILNPGPGAYDAGTAAEHMSHHKRPSEHRSSVFVSSSLRFDADVGRKPDAAARGPGFYSPIREKRGTSFRLNLEGMWAC